MRWSTAILTLILPALATAAPTLSIEGECPGGADISIGAMTAGGQVAFLMSTIGEGSNVVPGGACAGTVTGLAGARMPFKLTDFDADGAIAMSPVLPDSACSAFVQVLDLTTCELSPVVDMSTVGAVGCVPSGARAPFDTLGVNTASGCYDGNLCHDDYSFSPDGAQNFQAFGEQASCTGAPTCVEHVAISTYSGSTSVCQGDVDVLCDGEWVGLLSTRGFACTGSAMASGCQIDFEPRMCSEITMETVEDGDLTTGCCGGINPDMMISGFSAW
ncbi:MAG: hypothetical protein ACI8PZ_006921 [Myxococcota bacterium]|jgi:hypothetical protein